MYSKKSVLRLGLHYFFLAIVTVWGAPLPTAILSYILPKPGLTPASASLYLEALGLFPGYFSYPSFCCVCWRKQTDGFQKEDPRRVLYLGQPTEGDIKDGSQSKEGEDSSEGLRVRLSSLRAEEARGAKGK